MLTDKEKLDQLKINQNSDLYVYYIAYGSFNNNISELDEIFDINELYEENIKNNYWEDEYPDIKNSYLRLSNIEGEGSYFYSLKDDSVYDVSWDEMNRMFNKDVKPRWNNFLDFEEEINECQNRLTIDSNDLNELLRKGDDGDYGDENMNYNILNILSGNSSVKLTASQLDNVLKRDNSQALYVEMIAENPETSEIALKKLLKYYHADVRFVARNSLSARNNG